MKPPRLVSACALALPPAVPRTAAQRVKAANRSAYAHTSFSIAHLCCKIQCWLKTDTHKTDTLVSFLFRRSYAPAAVKKTMVFVNPSKIIAFFFLLYKDMRCCLRLWLLNHIIIRVERLLLFEQVLQCNLFQVILDYLLQTFPHRECRAEFAARTECGIAV